MRLVCGRDRSASGLQPSHLSPLLLPRPSPVIAYTPVCSPDAIASTFVEREREESGERGVGRERGGVGNERDGVLQRGFGENAY